MSSSFFVSLCTETKIRFLMKKSTLGLIILLAPFVAGLLLGFLVGNCSGRHHALKSIAKESASVVAETVPSEEETAQDSSNVYEEPQMKEIIYHTRRIPYSTEFADLNEVHLQTARKVGLSRIPGTKDDVAKSRLTEIVDNDYYVIDKLQYSIPYLTARTAKELDAISKAFNDSLRSKQFPEYKLVVSSVLRTEEDIARLRRSGNPNASDNSAHCYGTTFDIPYTKYFREEETDEFMQPFELTKVLGEVLRDRRNAGKILVKYEKKEHCFHITVR